MEKASGVVVVVAVLAYGAAQFLAAFHGIHFHLGTGWTIAAFIASLLFRFTLPITVGAFFGAMDVWGWHWTVAALFAAPGLIFLIPDMISSLTSRTRRIRAEY